MNLGKQGPIVNKRPIITSGVSNGINHDMSGDPQILRPELLTELCKLLSLFSYGRQRRIISRIRGTGAILAFKG